MVLQKDISIDGLLARLPVRKIAGGQRKARNALCRDRSSSHFFSVDNLVKLFLDFPAYPLHWNLLKEFPKENGDMETRVGTVVSWRETLGEFLWDVKFSNSQVASFKCEDLANCLNRAYVLGLSVTGTLTI
jgi:hypothetical protein